MLLPPPLIGTDIDGTYDFPKTQTEGVEGQTSRQELVFLSGMAKGKKEADSISLLSQEPTLSRWLVLNSPRN